MVEEKDRDVQCDICMKWFHANCGKVGYDAFKAIWTTGGIDWFCPPCKKLAKDSRESVMQLIRKVGSKRVIENKSKRR